MKYKEFFVRWLDDNMPDEGGSSDPTGGGGNGDKK